MSQPQRKEPGADREAVASLADHGLAQIESRVRAEVYLEHREMLLSVDAVGIMLVAIGTPVLLWDHVPHVRLLLWAILLLAVTLAWSVTTVTPGETSRLLRGVRFVWISGSSILWAALPWLSPSAIQEASVAWVLAFVVAYGVASDIVFVPQTFDTSLNRLLAAYTSSYIVAFAIAAQWEPMVVVLIFVSLLMVGNRGWQRLVTNLIEKRVESESRTLIDDLTGVGSRAAAVAAIEQMRMDGTKEIHCIFVDIDDFKQVNDTYGYDTGDQALTTIAHHLRDHLPETWLIARFGGDEFVGVGPTAATLGDLLHVEIPLPGDFGGTTQSQHLSVGATCLPAFDAKPSNLFREAGAAVRRAKQAGKNAAVVMNRQLRSSEAARNSLGSRLSMALDGGAIIPYGQPINDLRTGEAVGVELLARWPQADTTMVMPNEFVPIIEDQGRGPQLGRLMIAHAIELLTELSRRDSGIYVSVNLSARHLFHRDLPSELNTQLAEAAIAPNRLVLEVTESQHLPSSSIWQTTAEQLSQLGVGLAIDDFGTGYSSMEQLLSMPFSHLKLDRIITSSLDKPGTADLAAAICGIAADADMTTIAEGIETIAQRDQLLAAGYIFGQGYLYSRPKPLDEFLVNLNIRDHVSHVG